MARRANILSVFIASPGDVVAERDTVEDVIAELNKILGKETTIQLEAIRWETDVHPGIGDDPQDVVNEQVKDDYDIFVGILWARFGTPTKRAGSGTEEEFDQAYERHRQDPRTMRVLVYFKTTPVPPDDLDTRQLELVQQFRKRIAQQGVLSKSFDGPAQFGKMLRRDLAAIMRSWGTDWGEAVGARSGEMLVKALDQADNQPRSGSSSNASDARLDHLLGESLNCFNGATEARGRISAALAELQGTMHGIEQGLLDAQHPGAIYIGRQLRQAFSILADAYSKLTSVIETETAEMLDGYRASSDAFSGALAELAEQGPIGRAELQTALSSIESTAVGLQEAVQMTHWLREQITRMRQGTGRFRDARTRLLTALDNLKDVLATAANRFRVIHERMVRLTT